MSEAMIKVTESVAVTLTKEELRHLINDTIAAIWRIKKIVFKDNWNFSSNITEVDVLTEEQKSELTLHGYYSRKELLDKLEKIEEENFPELSCCCG